MYTKRNMTFHPKAFRPTTAFINLNNLSHNIQVLRSAVGENVFFCPMVKANAYGHGDVEIALCLEKEKVKTVGVGLIEEGVSLRQMGVSTEILVFGLFGADGADEIVQQRLTPVISTWEQLEFLEKSLNVRGSSPWEIHLKFDTGMNRVGFDVLEAEKVFMAVTTKKKYFQVKGICTHLYSGEDASCTKGASYDQLRKFLSVEKIFAPLTPISHALNTFGLLNFVLMKRRKSPQRLDISMNQGVRPGLAIYGYNPLSEPIPDLELRPVMSLHSKVVQYRRLNVGESVSYGHTWKARRRSLVGLVPVGYADGVHRILSNRSSVLCEGVKVPIVGNICMDYLMIDLTDIQNSPLEESDVTLFGYDRNGTLLSASEVAAQSQTITWEVLTSIGERVPRVTITQELSSGVRDSFQQERG